MSEYPILDPFSVLIFFYFTSTSYVVVNVITDRNGGQFLHGFGNLARGQFGELLQQLLIESWDRVVLRGTVEGSISSR